MSVPEHLWRSPTSAAIASLAERFGLPNKPGMQDWEWEVSDPNRIDEFLEVYEAPCTTEDELFVLMEILLQSFCDAKLDLSQDVRWSRVMNYLDGRAELHAHTIWYWSCLDAEKPDFFWPVTPYIREILANHHKRWERIDNR